ncbi:hypothetical protein DL240_01320 [Lujinxingia litoralis]|uniref:Peptidase M43 pregnancy-associated plasma-A domain-containing protein n=1 Tax=Lujinxingia litoralis TaxID=2211119 RepID=A0A328C8E5_9DELT|nr:hypothetical protein [Lujinxingia litoralis]RAL24877.1 hypothetical protein DL240_01320 [Lujinxingia litoralis]
MRRPPFLVAFSGLLLAALAPACSGPTDQTPEEPIIVIEDDPVKDTDADAGADATPDTDTTPPPSGEVDGEACQSDRDCRSGFCAPEPDWPGGYCTTIDCNSRADCQSDGQNNACLLPGRGSNFCVRMCTSTSECREGYICMGISNSEGYCAPNPAPPFDGMGEDFPFEVTCTPAPEGRADLRFNVSEGLHSFTVVPFVESGYRLGPNSVTANEDGTSFNLRQGNSFQAAGAQLFGFINPTIIPAVPQDVSKVRSGEHTYRLATNAGEICHYVLERPTRGNTIDLNIYLVGLGGKGLTAHNAHNHNDLQEVLGHVEDTYSQAGITLGQVRYFAVDAESEAAYQVVRSETDVARLAMLTEPPGTDADSVLSANLILVKSFSFTGAEGVLGISMGIPGAPALHGSGISGVALTGAYIGTESSWGSNPLDGNEFTASIIAHELGHFLGLFHTTETTGSSFDPLADTERCTDLGSSNPTYCPDWGNMMFPLADVRNTEISAGQAHTMGVNPLIK